MSQDDQVKAYIKKIMSQLNRWMLKSKISKLVIVITSKETGEDLERWQFDVLICVPSPRGDVLTRHRYKFSQKAIRTDLQQRRKSKRTRLRREWSY